MGAKVYITKYALSTGIKEAIVVGKFNVGNMEIVNVVGYHISFEIGLDAFFSKDEAIEHAEKMRLNEIGSLKNKIKELENLKFE